MTTSINPEHLIIQVKRVVESNKRSEIRLNANGGNSILLVCPPDRELQFIDEIYKQMSNDSYKIISLEKMLISFVDDNIENIRSSFELLKGSVNQIFKAPEGEICSDLFSSIINEIKKAFDENKIPILINSGALFGSGIDNIHLMENESVMTSNKPLIILYPATQEGDKLLFLNTRHASKYRCMIIN
ncbi:MAG: hypothetical protein PHE33_09720 [Bacteroidales bacterium]|nr:hypothetical protein [Bacteroidales bacterium]